MKKEKAKITKAQRAWFSREMFLLGMETALEWGFINQDLRRFTEFVVARNAVRIAREAGKREYWSPDPILRNFHFCNISRENDRVTRWIAANWREPHQADPDLWFASVLARRCINLPDTLTEIGYPVPWNPDHYLEVTKQRTRRGKQRFNSRAYRLTLNDQSGDLPERQVKFLLNPLWAARDKFRPHSKDTLDTFHARLAAVPLMGGFYTGQVVADLKYVGPLRNAPDWWDFAVSGPGSRRGLSRAMGLDLGSSWPDDDWARILHPMRHAIAPKLSKAGLPKMHAQDMEHCLWEFDRYERIRLGEGKGRKFVPNPEALPSVKD